MNWNTRIPLFLAAVGATAAYAGSFFLLPGDVRNEIPRIAAMVAIAAAISWPIFGTWLVCFGRSERPKYALPWADICLRTMVRGNAVLGLAILLNLFFTVTDTWNCIVGASAHLAILVAANLTMARYFIRAAAEVGTCTRSALLAWLAGLNLPFILILVALWNFI